MMGIFLAIPIALGVVWPGLSPDPFMVFEVPPLGGWPGLMPMMIVGWLLYQSARPTARDTSRKKNAGAGVG
jgi:hypothetical protein